VNPYQPPLQADELRNDLPEPEHLIDALAQYAGVALALATGCVFLLMLMSAAFRLIMILLGPY
jgi:hypothetical protein